MSEGWGAGIAQRMLSGGAVSTCELLWFGPYARWISSHRRSLVWGLVVGVGGVGFGVVSGDSIDMSVGWVGVIGCRWKMLGSIDMSVSWVGVVG